MVFRSFFLIFVALALFSCATTRSPADFEDSEPARLPELGVEDGGWDGLLTSGVSEPGSLGGEFDEVGGGAAAF